MDTPAPIDPTADASLDELSRSAPAGAVVELADPNFIAYRVTAWPRMKIVRAPRPREWMDNTNRHFANRCLPLLIANQAGWWILNSTPMRMTWTGGWDISCIRIHSLDGQDHLPAVSHFGHGILTWHLPFLFRTPKGYNLHVRGPANLPKDGIAPLEGIVESDWSMATFTMNWQFTRPNHEITFGVDEPICMISPTPRGLLEAMQPSIRDVNSDPVTANGFATWSKSRGHFIKDLRERDPSAVQQQWQKHYFQGTAPDGAEAPEHQSKLNLREFDDQIVGISAPPPVATHPEVTAILSKLFRSEMSSDDAMQALSAVVQTYLPPRANDAKASLIGVLLCRAQFPASRNEVSDAGILAQWEASSGVASEKAIPLALFSWVVGTAMYANDEDVLDGAERFWKEQLSPTLPDMGNPFESGEVDSE